MTLNILEKLHVKLQYKSVCVICTVLVVNLCFHATCRRKLSLFVWTCSALQVLLRPTCSTASPSWRCRSFGVASSMIEAPPLGCHWCPSVPLDRTMRKFQLVEVGELPSPGLCGRPPGPTCHAGSVTWHVIAGGARQYPPILWHISALHLVSSYGWQHSPSMSRHRTPYTATSVPCKSCCCC